MIRLLQCYLALIFVIVRVSILPKGILMAVAKRAKKSKAKKPAKKAVAKKRKAAKKKVSKKSSKPKAKKAAAKRKTTKASKSAKFVTNVIKQTASAHKVATRETKAIAKALSALEKQGVQLNKKLAKAKAIKSIETKIAKNERLIQAAKEHLQTSQITTDKIASLLDAAREIESPSFAQKRAMSNIGPKLEIVG